VTVPVFTQPLLFVTVTVYTPALIRLALVIALVCWLEVKLPGPLQLYELPPADCRFKVEPEHKGLLQLAVTTGNVEIFTLTLPVPIQPFDPVPDTV
jgi:hypothetical protein